MVLLVVLESCVARNTESDLHSLQKQKILCLQDVTHCDKSPLPDFQLKHGLWEILCFVPSDKDGLFRFPALPNGKFKLVRDWVVSLQQAFDNSLGALKKARPCGVIYVSPLLWRTTPAPKGKVARHSGGVWVMLGQTPRRGLNTGGGAIAWAFGPSSHKGRAHHAKETTVVRLFIQTAWRSSRSTQWERQPRVTLRADCTLCGGGALRSVHHLFLWMSSQVVSSCFRFLITRENTSHLTSYQPWWSSRWIRTQWSLRSRSKSLASPCTEKWSTRLG